MELTTEQLDNALEHLLNAPTNNGVIDTLCIRPKEGERRFVKSLEVSPKEGVSGDRWLHHTWMHVDGGEPDPRIQVCLLPKRMLDLAWQDRAAQPYPGDNLIVDMYMGLDNLPIGSILRIGTSELEVSDVYNGGCDKWVARYGNTSFRWINTKDHQPLRLRGILCNVKKAGVINIDDRVQKA